MLYRVVAVTVVAMVAAAGSDAGSTRDPDDLVVHGGSGRAALDGAAAARGQS